MEQSIDPAPALSRGLALIRQLSFDGQGTLEHLARRGGWPKSSTLRYLKALEIAGVVEQDFASKIWHLKEQLVPLSTADPSRLDEWRDRLGGLSQEIGHCAELYQVSPDAITLVDRVDPLVQDKQLSARIGFVRDLSECDATALLFFAFSERKPATTELSWRWRSGERTKVRGTERNRLLRNARSSTVVTDEEFNINGIRRFAFGLIGPDDRLEGILAIAQRLTPLSPRQTDAIQTALEKLYFEAARSSATTNQPAKLEP